MHLNNIAWVAHTIQRPGWSLLYHARIKNSMLRNVIPVIALTPCFRRYMSTSAEAIGINAQFLYAPDCMLISFLVRTNFHQDIHPSKINLSSSALGHRLLTSFSTIAGQGHPNHKNDNGHRPPRDRPGPDELRARHLRRRPTRPDPLRGRDRPAARAHGPGEPVRRLHLRLHV